jgi:hypothetical protein
MAITTNNDELNKYNDLLRESINYSKQLSDNVLALAGRMARMTMSARATRSAMADINRDISKTLQLSDKLNQGKLKQKEIDTQITKLTNTYQKYIDETAAGVNSINATKQQEINLNSTLIQQQQHQNRLLQDISTSHTKLTSYAQQLANLNGQITGANATTQGQIQQQIDAIKILIRDEEDTLRIKEGQLDSSKRISKAKADELTKVERIVQAHDNLLDIYEKELDKAAKIKEELEKQNTLTNKINNTYKDISKLLNPFTAIFEFVKKMAFAISDQVTRIQKGLVVSREEAYELRQGFNDAAVASGNIAVNTERMVAANAELGKQLGFNSRFSNDMNIEFIKLTKQIGLSDEAAGGLAKLSKASGMNFKDTKNIVLETTQRLSSQYGIQLDQKDVLEEIGKISGQTLAMLKGNPKALTEAVAQARLLGTNLENVKKQASSLLDFETSIENELQAELITGRQFNLERARSAALTGNLTVAMQELNSQGIDFNNFSNMNVIAQEKIAGMLGMQTDELSDQLLKQKYMGMSQEQVAALAGEEVAKRLEALSAQDKFNLAVEKMQDIVTSLVGGSLGQFVDMMAKALESSAGLYSMMLAIAGISLGKTLASLATLAIELELSAAGAIATASAISFGLAAVGIIAGIAAMMGAFSDSKEEATSVGDLSYSKGKTIISTKEGGLFEPSPNDDIAVAPGIGDMINRPQQQTAVVQDNSAIVNGIALLNDTMKSVKDGVGQLYNKNTDIYMGPNKVGQSLTQNNYNLA